MLERGKAEAIYEVEEVQKKDEKRARKRKRVEGERGKQTSFAHKSNNAGLIFYVEPGHVVSAIRLTVRPSRESSERAFSLARSI